MEVAGNIGPAALDALMQRMDANKWPHLWALELSSFQLETTSSLRPDAATVLNLSEDHLDRYDSIEEYAAAKHGYFPARIIMVACRYSIVMMPGCMPWRIKQ